MDALVNYKYLLAVQKNIEMQVEICIPEELNVDTADLCIILGNLLDNAIEAAEKCEKEKRIRLKILYGNRNIRIEIANTFDGEIHRMENGMYMTSKKDAKRHGIGLQSVQKSIDKYKGKTTKGKLLPILSNQKMNSYLKEIADLCGIKKNLTFHLARHNKNYIYLNMK